MAEWGGSKGPGTEPPMGVHSRRPEKGPVDLQARRRTKDEPRERPLVRKADFWARLPSYVAGFGWLTVGVAFFFVVRAQPVSTYEFFSRMATTRRRTTWDMDELQVAAIIMTVVWVASMVGILAHSRRLKRTEDRYHMGLLLLAAFSLACVVTYLLAF